MSISINGNGITSANIADGAITNADINSSAAIDGTKISGSFGKVLQVIYAPSSTGTSTTSSTFVNSSITGIITPSSTSNKILISASIVCQSNALNSWNGDLIGLMLAADGVDKFDPDPAARFGMRYTSQGDSNSNMLLSFNYLHSPATTSAVTYLIKLRTRGGQTVSVNSNSGVSSLTMMEIGA